MEQAAHSSDGRESVSIKVEPPDLQLGMEMHNVEERLETEDRIIKALFCVMSGCQIQVNSASNSSHRSCL